MEFIWDLDFQILLKIVMLSVLVIVATYTDIRARRVPNVLTFSFMIAGLLLNTLINFPMGIKIGLLGLFAGLLVFIIPYVMGAMGGGDVKLLAAIGAITNVNFVIYTVIFTSLIGGIIIIITKLKEGQLCNVFIRTGKLLSFYILSSVYIFVKHPKIYYFKEQNRLDKIESTMNYMPYAVAIAGGVFIAIYLAITGDSLFV